MNTLKLATEVQVGTHRGEVAITQSYSGHNYYTIIVKNCQFRGQSIGDVEIATETSQVRAIGIVRFMKRRHAEARVAVAGSGNVAMVLRWTCSRCGERTNNRDSIRAGDTLVCRNCVTPEEAHHLADYA